MQIRSFPEHLVPMPLRRQMVELQSQAWPATGEPSPAPWHDPDLHPESLLLVDYHDTVVAALDILSKEIRHGGATYAARGISAMVTDRARRGQGYGRTLATAAREMMKASGADLGIFTCDRPLQAFYESAGWHELRDAVLVGGTPDEPFPSDRLDKVVMVDFFTERARAAAVAFAGSRIELHPGVIDRLW